MLRQSVCQRFPFVPARAATVYSQLSFWNVMLRVALDRNDIDGFRFMRMHVNRKPEVGRKVPADFMPGLAGIVAAHDVPMFLHEQHVRFRRVHRDAVDTVPDFRIGVRKFELGFQTAVYRSPSLASIVSSEHPSRGDS